MKFFWISLSILTAFVIQGKNHQALSDSGQSEYNWASIADSVHNATFETFLSEDGQYIAQDNVGNQTFNYWNAHVLDVLVDAHLRGQDQEHMMLTILRGIKIKNKWG